MTKGFTLVELLAVIVILAIIALIATPVVLSIIEDTKQSAMLRSAEMYLSGVENAVMRENMNAGGNFRPNDCTISNGTLSCNGTTVEVEVNGEVPNSGTIVFENGKIKEVELIYESGTIVKDSNGDLVYEGSSGEKTLATICTYQNNGVAEKTAGAKYSCEVSPGVSYNFYVLTTPAEGDTTINLIMDRNIYYDGTSGSETTSTNTGLVAWMSDSTYGCGSDGDYCATNDKGPVTAMTYLYNATKDWTNISPVNYTYNDRTVQGNSDGEGYTSFVSTNGVATITSVTGTGVTIGTSEYPLRVRMPIYSSDASITEITSKTNASYLYDNLDPDGIDAPYGYWTLSSCDEFSYLAWYVHFSGGVGDGDVFNGDYRGVRPVINVKL